MDELISYIHERTYHFLHDANTFAWAKYKDSRYFDDQFRIVKDEDIIGGGNLLVGLGLLTSLTYLSKVYWLLEGRSLVNSWARESETFAYLITNAPVGYFGLSGDPELLRMFNIARHKLVHLISPGGEGENTVTMMSSGPNEIRHYKQAGLRSYRQFKRAIASNPAPAITLGSNRVFFCNVELLARDTTKICDWLCGKIQAGDYSEAKIAATLDWLRRELSEDRHSHRY